MDELFCSGGVVLKGSLQEFRDTLFAVLLMSLDDFLKTYSATHIVVLELFKVCAKYSIGLAELLQWGKAIKADWIIQNTHVIHDYSESISLLQAENRALKEELRSVYNKFDCLDAKLDAKFDKLDAKFDEVLNILYTKEIHDISASSSPKSKSSNSPKNKRYRQGIAETADDFTDERRDEVNSTMLDESTSAMFFGGRIRTAVPSSSLTEAHTALSTSFVNHYKKEDLFLPTKEKNRRNRCISFMKTLLQDEEKSFLNSQVPSPSNKAYSTWRSELNNIADNVQERAMTRLLTLEGKDTTKKYKLQPTIPAVDKRLTTIGESKWNSEEVSKASAIILQNFLRK